MPEESTYSPLFYLMKPNRIPVIAIHIAGWILFQCLPIVFILSFTRTTDISTLFFSTQYWGFCFYFIALFYFHTYVLLPFLLVKKRWLWYVLTMVFLLCTVIYLQPFEQLIRHAQPDRGMEQRDQFRNDNRNLPMVPPPPGMQRGEPGQGPGGPPRNNDMRGPRPSRRPLVDIISIFLFIITLCLSAAIDIGRRWRLSEQRIARAEADRANAELSFLKAQINPHFLFNTLNNIYSMVMTGNEHTGDSVLKLSNILRYVIDEGKEDYVSLQSEVDCISDYIDLQKLRLGKKVSLEYIVNGNLEHKRIAPMVLMTFIENVFKYGTSSHEEAHLVIRLEATEKGIHFFAQNKLFAIPRRTERTGIGITNTQKRLMHLYPNKHELLITRENGLFSVDLFLQD